MKKVLCLLLSGLLLLAMLPAGFAVDGPVKVGDQYFLDIEDAANYVIENQLNGAVIQVLQDITMDYNIDIDDYYRDDNIRLNFTIDLGGYTLERTYNETDFIDLDFDYGYLDLTIRNGRIIHNNDEGDECIDAEDGVFLRLENLYISGSDVVNMQSGCFGGILKNVTIVAESDGITTNKDLQLYNVTVTSYDEAVDVEVDYDNNRGAVVTVYSGTFRSTSGDLAFYEECDYGYDYDTIYCGEVRIAPISTAIPANWRETEASYIEVYADTAEETPDHVWVFADDGGSVSGGSNQLKKGDSITVRAQADEGYEFVGWYQGSALVSSDAEYTFTFEEDRTLTAQFRKVSGTDAEGTGEDAFLDDDFLKSYTDVLGHWGYDAIRFVVSENLFKGTSESHFSPDVPMSIEMFATVLARMAGVDTEGTPWYAKGIEWAQENQLAEEALFANTAEPITREELVMMLYQFAQKQEFDVSVKADLSGLGDAATIGEAASDAFAWAYASGIVVGDLENNVNPQKGATRAEVALMLMRFSNQYMK